MVKLVVDTLPTVPTAPPAAGPERALDPLASDPRPLGEPVAATGFGALGEDDVVRPMERPITVQTSAAAATTIHRPLLLDSNRRTLRRCA
jgi:hypothetical protein